MDVSTPCGVRDGGAMWNKDNRSYSTMDNCKQDDEYDWTTMGHTSYMELMAEKAEEYDSHDKTILSKTY